MNEHVPETDNVHTYLSMWLSKTPSSFLTHPLHVAQTSVVLGTGLPFALAKAGIDPANAGTSIQVVMDILGVAITCVTCDFILEQFASSL